MRAEPAAVATHRREAILGAAVELFRDRGFHSVGIDEIGIAAGISGPGVYRHFASKGAVLVALFDALSEQVLIAAEEIHKADHPPDERLDRLVALHVSTAVEQRARLAVWIQDRRSLPAGDLDRIGRRQAEYVAIWIQALVRLRPELAPADADVLVHAALGAVDSVALHDAGLPGAELEARLRKVAAGVLRTP
ncbi:MAG TPA: TetR/AcrR family transcriptional regulator [Acidimicrobiia bacterium]|nr:TetR/AcrR family transcriptional regulator [Acidimicrobiia bacterium]